MDSKSNAVAIEPIRTKSIKAESSNANQKTTDDLIIIDDSSDSLDSAYETGSAVSRSTQSSPTSKP